MGRRVVHSRHLTISFRINGLFVPADEIFGSENVVRLYLYGLTIDQHQLKLVRCSGLRSLTLYHSIISRDSFFKILSCCTLIENLSLAYVKCLDDDIDGARPTPPLTTINVLPKLRSLHLCHVEPELLQIETLCLDDLSSKFPNLKHLTLCLSLRKQVLVRNCISSDSLETLNLVHSDKYPHAELEFHVPNIRKLTFEGEYIPNLSFRSKSQYQWESHVKLVCSRYGDDKFMSTMWFHELCKFLAKLSRSKIHLRLYVLSRYFSSDYKVNEMTGLKVCEVETVNMDTEGLCSREFHDRLLDGLFRICRPKMVDGSPPNSSHVVTLRRALEQGMAVKSSSLPRWVQYQTIQPAMSFVYTLCNLEEVNAQELVGNVWRSQPMDTIISDDSTGNEERRFRFQLKWKQ